MMNKNLEHRGMGKRMLALAMAGIMVFGSACGAQESAVSGSTKGSTTEVETSVESKVTAANNDGTQLQSISTTSADGSSAQLSLEGRSYTLSYPEYKDNYDYKEADSDATLITLSGDSASVSGSGVSVDGSTVTITEKGYYILSGKLNDGQIIVDAGDENAVRLYLDGVTINNDDGPAIWIKSAKNAYISLEEGSTNVLSDSGSYTLEEGEDEPDAVIFSKADLILNGSGSLTINATYACGIRSKDDLVIREGTYVVNALTDAIKGKDLLSIYDGDFTIACGGKGLASTNNEEDGKGIVYVEGGSFDINTTDDGIHSNVNVILLGGDFTIQSGDDGIHADGVTLVYNSKVDITKSYEGIEGMIIDLVGSNVSVVASDDGLNAAGDVGSDNDGSGGGTWGNRSFMDGDESNIIYIDGGYVYVNSRGDGIDSNGYLYIYDGEIVVDGPEDNGNGFLDYGIDCVMSGGTLTAAGSSGMLQSIGEDSTVTAIVVGCGNNSAGSTVSIQDAKGNEVASYTPSKSYSAVLFAGFGFEQGESYTASVDGNESGSVTIEKASNTIGSVSSMGGMGGMGGMQGGFGGGRGGRMGGESISGNGAGMQEGFTPGELPEGQMPEAGMQGGFAPGGQMQGGFDPSQMQDGSQMPGDGQEMTPPEGFGDENRGGRGRKGGESSGTENSANTL